LRALRRGIAIAPVALVLALPCSAAPAAPQGGGGAAAGLFAPLPPGLGLASGTHHRRSGGGRRGRPRPAPATVLAVQRLFHVLGYPLGRERGGRLGVRTRGALSYFQRKYGLPITGYPDGRTVMKMRAVAASLTAAPASERPLSRDLIDRLLGGVPLMALGLACALGLALLALAARRSDALPDR
jgi:hypothetical protein